MRVFRTFTMISATAIAATAIHTPAVHAAVRPHAGMLRFPDISKTHIVFLYANDLWLVPREGGTATPLASPPGAETFPKFSPDGQSIAFVGNYDGDRDIYTIPAQGGVATRVTHHPANEVLCDWTPDGELLFYANGLAGLRRQTQLFTVGATGGLPSTLPVPYGATGAISPDGQWLAYTPHTRDSRTWKRYRGGMATDIWLFNLNDYTSKKITDWEGTDTLPMWQGDKLYYLSDAGDAHKLNIWMYNTASGARKQITRYSAFDVKWPSIGPGPKGRGEIVYQNGPDLYTLNLADGMSKPVEITIPGDRPTIRAHAVDASKKIQSWSISPSGKRAVVQARGDVWTLPAKNGSPRNLTRTSGVAERDPSWSPDGQWIAYLSDESGEYELYIMQSDGKGETKRLTTDGAVFRYEPLWSPDSKRIAFTDKTGALFLHTIESGETALVDRDPWGNRLTPSFSHDSRWITYARTADKAPTTSIWIYNIESGQKQQATSGMFNDSSPTFDRKGDYLYFASARSFSPSYSDLDTTFIYAGASVLLAVPLRADMESPYAPKSDEESWGDDSDKGDADKSSDDADDDQDSDKDAGDKPAPDDGLSGVWEGSITGDDPIPPGGMDFSITIALSSDGSISGSMWTPAGTGTISSGAFNKATGALTLTVQPDEGPSVQLTLQISGESIQGALTSPAMGLNADISGKRTQVGGVGDDDDDADKDDSKAEEEVVIDFEGFERRAIILPAKHGRFGQLAVNNKGALLYTRLPVGDGKPSIMLLDITDEKKEEKTVAAGAGAFDITPDGKMILVLQGEGAATIQKAAAGASGKPVVKAGMTTMLDPRQEWAQVFNEVWRLDRDFFYDVNMHGVDWEGVRKQYAAMLNDCVTREDVGFVIREMISELNVGHSYYRGGGDVEDQPSVAVGMLGCDYEVSDGAFRISRILEGAPWDADARGPLSQPGVDVHEGDYLLAVNGVALDTSSDPWAAFEGLVGRAITITVGANPTIDDDSRDIVIKPIASEANLRYRAWIEKNRAYVAYHTDGKVGYIHVPDTGVNGQNNLYRQFVGQLFKGALIIDERWNAGGQIPTRFIEMLNRPITNYWARRDGADWPWPPDAHQGPKCMLINGLAGSGGDAFPAYFRQAGLGKLIGMRTWGGLVGISGNPGLIDGSGITVPTFGYYKTNGRWGIEGHGVDPDIEVIDDPALMRDGGDPQLDVAIEQMMREMQERPYTPPSRPASPDRSGMVVTESDQLR